ncbi:MAG TPA: hypothetical protein VL651_09330 [Bacteroidia bacterium]|jgi:hypothetical protein|nr:hypothetical protein [Bacteroidia bacterium]
MGTKLRFGNDLPAFQKYFGHFVFLILLFYSIYYSTERTCYVDSAWQFFQRVNDETFVFPFMRYGVFFSEIPLFLAVKFHLPFHLLVYIFSASYIVLYYLVWRLVTYTLKNPAAGLTIVLGMFMGIRENFLHTVGELHQAIVFSALLFAILNYQWRSVYRKTIFGISVALLVMFTHPLGAFAAGFAVLFTMICEKKITMANAVVLALIGIIVILRFIFPDNINDAGQYARVRNSSSYLTSFSESGALRFLLIHSRHFYWLAELMLLVTLLWMCVARKWFALCVYLFSLTTYLLLAVTTFHDGDSSIMVERLFLPALFMIDLVFASLVFEYNGKLKPALVLLVLFFTVNGIRFINAGCLFYQQRDLHLAELIKKTKDAGSDKSMILKSDINGEQMMVTWALGAESLVYSTITDGKSTLVSADNGKCPDGFLQLADQSFYTTSQLNRKYFILSDKPYTRIK